MTGSRRPAQRSRYLRGLGIGSLHAQLGPKGQQQGRRDPDQVFEIEEHSVEHRKLLATFASGRLPSALNVPWPGPWDQRAATYPLIYASEAGVVLKADREGQSCRFPSGKYLSAICRTIHDTRLSVR